MEAAVELRRLRRDELTRVAEIDRSEHISVLYEQQGSELLARPGDWTSLPWDPDGDGEHSVSAQVRTLEHYVEAGGIAIGAFTGEHLTGLAVVVPHLRPGIAQLAYLHVTAPMRGRGIGGRLCDRLEEIARAAGDSEIVVTATPTGNTVGFYRGRGYEPMADPLTELLELEPEDVHMCKVL